MKKHHRSLVLGVCALLALVACTDQPRWIPTVYASGYYRTAAAPSIPIPCYWIGTAKTDLQYNDPAYGAAPQDIVVSGGTVYVGGWYPTATSVYACY